MTLTKDEYFDTLNYGSFVGSMQAVCMAESKGFLSNDEKLDLILLFKTNFAQMLKDKTTFTTRKEDVFKNIKDIFPNCLP